MSLLSAIPQVQSNYFHKDFKSYPSFEFRLHQLRRLEAMLEEHEEDFVIALQKDLGRPTFECVSAELLPIRQELREAKRNLKKWMKPQAAGCSGMSAIHWKSKAQVAPQPYGVCLIMGPWNYPVQLLLSPLVGAMAAGNFCVLKPSEHAPACSRLLAELIPQYLDNKAFVLVEGGAEIARGLLDKKFDFIFFTGGTEIGREVMQAAAKNLTPVILELGGKCPAILDEKLPNFEIALKRIVWGKLLNTGQTCVSPDFLLVPESRYEEAVNCLRKIILKHYQDPEAYGKIINQKHFERLRKILKSSQVLIGGNSDSTRLKIEPSVVLAETKDDAVMQQEIFGPILALVKYKRQEDILDWIQSFETPLALYVFSQDKPWIEWLKKHSVSGALLVNDVVIHLTRRGLPFGGVGASGFGSYHGYYGFKNFSHWKAIEEKTFWPELALRYPPYPSKIPRFWRRFL